MSAGPTCREALLSRTSVYWPRKMVANTVALVAFFVAYFWVQALGQDHVMHMPLTALDRWVPYVPAAIVPYVSLWIYVSLPLSLLTRRIEFMSYGVPTVAMACAGLLCFLLWPTAVPMDPAWSGSALQSPLRALDSAGNACPSLHVAFATFSWVWLRRLLGEMRFGRAWQWTNSLWCLAIVLSTVAIRQHVVLDVVAGIALAVVFAAWSLSWLQHTRASGRSSAPPVTPRAPEH